MADRASRRHPSAHNSMRPLEPEDAAQLVKRSMVALATALGLAVDSQGLIHLDRSGQLVIFALCLLLMLVDWREALGDSQLMLVLVGGLTALVLISVVTSHRHQIQRSEMSQAPSPTDADLDSLIQERESQLDSQSSRSGGSRTEVPGSTMSRPDGKHQLYLDSDRPANLKPEGRTPDLALDDAGNRLMAYRGRLILSLAETESNPGAQCADIAPAEMKASLPFADLTPGTYLCLWRLGRMFSLRVVEMSSDDLDPWLHLQMLSEAAHGD